MKNETYITKNNLYRYKQYVKDIKLQIDHLKHSDHDEKQISYLESKINNIEDNIKRYEWEEKNKPKSETHVYEYSNYYLYGDENKPNKFDLKNSETTTAVTIDRAKSNLKHRFSERHPEHYNIRLDDSFLKRID